MIVIVEGIDRVGKTTLCKKLEAQGFTYFKDSWALLEEAGAVINESGKAMYQIGKLDTALTFTRALSDIGVNIVLDRMHLTEFVYGSLGHGRKVEKWLLDDIDGLLGSYEDVVIAHVLPTDLKRSNREAGIDLQSHLELFEHRVRTSCIGKKISCSFPTLDSAVEKIMGYTFKYDFYLASPFFNSVQNEREDSVKAILRHIGFKVYSPKEDCVLSHNSSLSERQRVFDDNVDAIYNSRAVFAITDEKDMGTIWESGFACGINKPVLYFAESLQGSPFNLMLAHSGRAVFTSRDQLTASRLCNALISQSQIEYGGAIE